MDLLAPLLNHLPPSTHYYFSGLDCEGASYDGKAPVGYLHLVRSGRMRLSVAGAPGMLIDQPCVLFFPRPCAHEMIPAAGGVELVCGTVDLGIAEQSPLATSLPGFVVIPVAEMPTAESAFELLCQEAGAVGRIGREAAVDRLLEYFLIQVLRHLVAQGRLSGGALAAMGDPRLALALNAMHEQPAHPWTLEQLAELATMSRARFAANFRRRAGVPPLEYLTGWRLVLARALMRQGRSLKCVAAAVGYGSPEAFARVFQRKLGETPGEWLRRHEIRPPETATGR